MNRRGSYVVIEGLDGTGKTTQTQLAVERRISEGHEAIYLHEPGGTDFGLEIEKLSKNRHLDRTAMTDLLLFTANRIESYEHVLQPALEHGVDVFADRNWLSSVAYQGVAGGVGVERVADITSQFLPIEYIVPRMTILLHTNNSHRSNLLGARATSDDDYFEQQPQSFQDNLTLGYDAAELLINRTAAVDNANHTPCERISAVGTIEEVHERIWSILRARNIV